jgi:uncharacterized protein (TIGR02466 family)
MTENVEQSVFNPHSFFPTTVYTIIKPEFLESVEIVSTEKLNEVKKEHKINETYPVVMSTSMIGDSRISEFETFLAMSGWKILDNQGYNMDNFNVYMSELWCQEHHKFSGMEQHVHSHGVMLSGFYFLEVSEESYMIQLHDPRAGKVQASLPERNMSMVTEASNSFFIKPERGMIVISNAWLPHSFTRNSSDTPCKFIHFNISVMTATQKLEKTEGPIII